MCFGSKSPSYPAPLPKRPDVPTTVPVPEQNATPTSEQTPTITPPVSRTTASSTGLTIPSV